MPLAVDFSSKRLLLVEDNEINRKIATAMLLGAGFAVDAAEDGQVAVEKLGTLAAHLNG